MSSLRTPIKDTMLPWMGTAQTNQSKMSSYMLQHSESKNNLNKNKVIKKQKSSAPKKNKTPTKTDSSTLSAWYFEKNKHTNRLLDYINITPKQSNLPDKDPDPPWGAPHTSKSSTTMRIWYTNPCGIGIDAYDIKSHSSFEFLRHHSKCDIVCLAETNVHW